MLVLGRKRGESLVIDERITVSVVRDGKYVRIGIDAPPEMKIRRSEIPPQDTNRADK